MRYGHSYRARPLHAGHRPRGAHTRRTIGFSPKRAYQLFNGGSVVCTLSVKIGEEGAEP